MQQSRVHLLFSRVVAYVVISYGLLIITGTLMRQVHLHSRHMLVAVLASLPLLIGLSYVYLGSLLLRLKYNAWMTTIALSLATSALSAYEMIHRDNDLLPRFGWLRVLLPLALVGMLLVSRRLFRVRSDTRSFTQAVRMSFIVLLVAFVYGVAGFSLLDKHDFHQKISVPTAVHQTLDQFGLTTQLVTPHSKRGVLFVDSLSAISIGALVYVALSFFQPLRMSLTNQAKQREHAEQLLRDYPSDLDDFFKLWPHDKHYFFDSSERAGLAYHVSRGIALVVANPFGDPKRFAKLLESFQELCFVNDWAPTFVHVDDMHRKLYERQGYRLQKLGEEAVLDLEAFQQIKNDKYFRQIRNRFTKLGYSVELLEQPHSPALLSRLHKISSEWLARPGRTERGFMMGYHSDEYLQHGPVAVVRDDAQQIQGFINLVPTYESHTANYDLLRCAETAPGNCNDFLLMGLIDILHEQGVRTLNLGLCPLAGLDQKAAEAGLIDTALRFVYANGDRFYSFSGLTRFKAKYQPAWHGRYVAYKGGIPMFSRAMNALTRVMRVK